MTKHESLEAVHTYTPYIYEKVWNNSICLSKQSNQQNKLTFGETKGITLIALVVTIVILLILAGVTINLLFSDTGLLSKAQQAKNTWENAEQSDINAIGELGNQVNEILNGTGTGGVTPEEIADITTLTEIQTENTKGKDIYGNVVMVPKGFKVVTEEATTVPEGIVIEDGTGTETTTGNQFVWIPVGTVYKDDTGTNIVNIQLGRYTFDTTTGATIEPLQYAYTSTNIENYKNEILIDTYHEELDESRAGMASTEIGIGENATAKNLAEFVQSVKNNNGYYLARYEASYGSGSSREDWKPLSKVSTTNTTSSMSYTQGMLWNWANQLDASKICQNMYANDNTVGVESDLVNSYAWDTAIVFIQEMDEGNNNYANKSDGNGILKNTGKTGDEKCNIHDMATNLREWTTEYSTYTISNIAAVCTNRGDSYDEGEYCTAYRHKGDATVGNYNVGFRTILYIR